MDDDRRIARVLAVWTAEGDFSEEATKAPQLEAEAKTLAAIDSIPKANLLGRLASLALPGTRYFYWRCIHGDPTCWDDLERFATYHALRYATEDPKTLFDTGPFARTLFDAIARRRTGRAKRLAETMNGRFRVGRKPWGDRAVTATLASTLHALWVGDEPTVEPRGPYAGLIEAWNDASAFEAECLRAIEYHLVNGEGGTDEFFGHYALIPVEFEAMRVVRESLGLRTPVIDHPFFATPFAAYAAHPGTYDPRADPIFVATVERLARDGRIPEGLDPYEV